MAARNENAGLLRQCVLLAAGITYARAWVGGNKRIAFAAADLSLRLTSDYLSGNPQEMSEGFEALPNRSSATSEEVDSFEAWLRGHVPPL
ncbi:MAG: hypothetical protein ACYC4U_34020 [Pirellulaceae bacterium]